MERPLVGSVWVAEFPYSDLTKLKRRPVFVLGYGEFGDLIVCQITSKARPNTIAIRITPRQFVSGHLPHISFVRYSKLFTISPTLILYTVGQLNESTTTKILIAVHTIFSEG